MKKKKMKRQASDWKKIPQYRYVGLVFKIDKESLQHNNKPNNQFEKKWA